MAVDIFGNSGVTDANGNSIPQGDEIPKSVLERLSPNLSDRNLLTRNGWIGSQEAKNNTLLSDYGNNNSNHEVSVPVGMDDVQDKLTQNGNLYQALQNKLYLIKLTNGLTGMDESLSKFRDSRYPKTFVDLCKMSVNGAGFEYVPEDFIYCKNLNAPLNKLITLRRFPMPCTDNIWDTNNQKEPDVARMVTFSTSEVNKLEDILSFNYRMKWKMLEAEMSQMSAEGAQAGFDGMLGKIMPFIDPTAAANVRTSRNRLNYDPKHDSNRVFGPVDSIAQTHIRDVGLEFTKDFEITFEYELRSWNGRTPEMAFKDLLANILACTFNNGDFWPGSRYWVGERPSGLLNKFRWLEANNLDKFLSDARAKWMDGIAALKNIKSSSALETLKGVLRNTLSVAIGKLLDEVGRPAVVMMDSLLSGSPIGNWHLTIGNPENPTMCIGNLILEDTDISFPTEALSYGEFPTKIQVKCKLKPAMPKDKAGIELMFNSGKSRLYFQPKTIKKSRNKKLNSRIRNFYGFDDDGIKETGYAAFDFVGDQGITEVETTDFSGSGDNDVIPGGESTNHAGFTKYVDPITGEEHYVKTEEKFSDEDDLDEYIYRTTKNREILVQDENGNDLTERLKQIELETDAAIKNGGAYEQNYQNREEPKDVYESLHQRIQAYQATKNF